MKGFNEVFDSSDVICMLTTKAVRASKVVINPKLTVFKGQKTLTLKTKILHKLK